MFSPPEPASLQKHIAINLALHNSRDGASFNILASSGRCPTLIFLVNSFLIFPNQALLGTPNFHRAFWDFPGQGVDPKQQFSTMQKKIELQCLAWLFYSTSGFHILMIRGRGVKKYTGKYFRMYRVCAAYVLLLRKSKRI